MVDPDTFKNILCHIYHGKRCRIFKLHLSVNMLLLTEREVHTRNYCIPNKIREEC